MPGYLFAVHNWGLEDYLAKKIWGHETAVIIFVLQPRIFTKKMEYLFNTVFGQDGIICDGVGWWSGFNKGFNIIEDIDIGLWNIVEGMGTNNRVSPDHRALIGSTIIVVDGGRIPQKKYFSLRR